MTDTTVKNGLIRYLFSKTAYTPATTWYLGLSTTDISADGTGYTEPASSSGYGRIAITNNTTNWDITNDNYVTNKIKIETNQVTVDCGTITNFFLSDSSTGGNARVWCKLATANYRPLPANSQIVINIGDFKATFTDND